MREASFHWEYLLGCVGLAVGEVIGFAMGGLGAVWPIVIYLSLLIALFGYGCEWRGWPMLALAFLGVALALRVEHRRAEVLDRAERENGPFADSFVVEGRVERRGRWASFDSSIDGVDMRVVVPLERGKTMPSEGETWRCGGWLAHRPLEDRRRRLLWVSGKGTFAERIAGSEKKGPKAWAGKLKKRLSHSIGIGLESSRRTAELNRAILLGERSRLDKKEKAMFLAAGTMHILAISGLHVMIIARIMMYAMLLLWVPVRLMAFALIPLLWGYTYMIGMSPSAVRAATMASVYFLAPLFWRKPNMVIAWSVTFLGFHLGNPAWLFDVGALLSFGVMLGILLFLRWSSCFGGGKWLQWGVSAAAWMAGTPIAACVFGRVTPGGLLANLVMIPLAEVSVVFGALGAIAGCGSEWLGGHLNNWAAMSTKLMLAVSWVISQFPFASFEMAPWTFIDCAIWYLVIALMAWLIRSVYTRRRNSL